MHYVYVLHIDGIPRYVGMGSGTRAWNFRPNSGDLTNRNGKVRAAIRNGATVRTEIVAKELTRKEALRTEDDWIVRLQKTLWNKRERWNNQDFREKRTEALREMLLDPKLQVKIRRGLKRAYKTSSAMRTGLEAGRTPEARKKQGRNLSQNHHFRMQTDPEYRAKVHEVRHRAALKAWRTRRKRTVG